MPGFLKLILCGSSVCICVCLRVCPPPRLLITSGVMWCDIDSRRLVKQVLKLLCNSCNMGTRDLPDMYAQSPRAEGIHIRQIMRAHVTSNMYHL